MEKAYEAKKYEDKIYKNWENSGLFNPNVCAEKGLTISTDKTFSIVLPPPNVTGTLHMGHAAMLAIEDVMVRYHRMKGDRTVWIPGTDHAAVATESKVEGILIEQGMKKPKEELGKDEFMKRVHQFAQDSHDTIVEQAKKMGASLDWDREAFTLDAVRNKAVRMVFKKMYDDGLIYRGYRVVNWSVKGQSTCSDDELVYVERPAKLYTFKYSKDFPITIATTRPETKLGDTAVAVHPNGKWKQYIGQTFTVENFGQFGHTLIIKVFGDDNVDDNFGTGALGVTTAHSPIDFEMYTKQKSLGNDIGLIQVIGEDGNLTSNAGVEYEGLSVVEAREKVVSWLKAEGLLAQEEEIIQNVGTSDRFKDVVEPLPKTQWFIDVNKKFVLKHSEIKGIESGEEITLKEIMQHVVRNKNISILPDRFEKTYFSWIDNLRDWCISRQIWYGHQIPVWYTEEEIYCGIEAPKGEGWSQDPDTLDTWFSSGLWTVSTLLDKEMKDEESWENWLDRSVDFKNFHPTSVLETGYDIIFFWVARMILMTTYATGQIPFETVYLHGLVRDEKGRKMSKSLGNIINPLDMIDKYGTDATRLSLLIGSTPGNDMKLSEEKIAGFRNFTNKLWNISRFILMNVRDENIKILDSSFVPEIVTDGDEWIMYHLQSLIEDVTTCLDNQYLSIAGDKLKYFTWNQLADSYLEFAKDYKNLDVMIYVLQTILKLWHPFMPFVTECIWSEAFGNSDVLMVQQWPKALKLNYSQDGFDQILALGGMSTDSKNKNLIRTTKKIELLIKSTDSSHVEIYKKNIKFIKRRFNASDIIFEVDRTLPTSREVAAVLNIQPETKDGYYPWEYINENTFFSIKKDKNEDSDVNIIDKKLFLQKEINHVYPYVLSMEKKLAGPFAANAPEAVVEGEKKKLAEAKIKLQSLEEQLLSL